MDTPNFSGWTCPRALQSYPTLVMGHGSGGRMMADLIRHLFAPQFASPELAQLADATVLDLPAGRIAFSTDSYVISPLVVPGGDIGELAVNGTVNDLAMMGAQPLYLTVGFILEEGLEVAELGRIAEVIGRAARAIGCNPSIKRPWSMCPAQNAITRPGLSPPPSAIAPAAASRLHLQPG